MFKSLRHLPAGVMLILLTASCSNNVEDDARFNMIGYFRNDKLRGFTYYVENPTRKAIQGLCAEKKAKLVDEKKTKRELILAFFDDEEQTPNVTIGWKYDWPKSADRHLVAKCCYDPFKAESELNFYKQMPE